MASTESNPEAGEQLPRLPETLLFRVGNVVYGCDVKLVRQVVRFRPPTRIPGAPPFVRGLLNVRGNVLTVLDVGMRLEPDRPPIETGSVIIAQVGDRRAGLAVDEVLHVGSVPEDPSDESPQGDPQPLVRKLGHLDGRIVLLLDVTAFVTQALV
ncbi:MAG TPA: chemotaxis protein CheW [Gemmatimonadaceae bacterium]|nr:chemotaxis protein CheW [Gemmatimonadaceae bacterium]